MLPTIMNFILALFRADSTFGTIKQDWDTVIVDVDALETAVKNELTDTSNPVLQALQSVETDVTLDLQYLQGAEKANLFNVVTRAQRLLAQMLKTESDIQQIVNDASLASLLSQYPATQAALSKFLASVTALKAAISSL